MIKVPGGLIGWGGRKAATARNYRMAAGVEAVGARLARERTNGAAFSQAMRTASNVKRSGGNVNNLGGIGAAMNAGPINTNAAVAASKSSKVGTWMRNRPKWQKYTAGGVAGIVGAKAVFGGGQNNGPYYNGY
jgi:hypothetical protein